MPPLPTTAHRMQSPRGSLEPSSWALSELFRRLRVEAMAVGREGDLMQRLASGQQPPPQEAQRVGGVKCQWGLRREKGPVGDRCGCARGASGDRIPGGITWAWGGGGANGEGLTAAQSAGCLGPHALSQPA